MPIIGRKSAHFLMDSRFSSLFLRAPYRRNLGTFRDPNQGQNAPSVPFFFASENFPNKTAKSENASKIKYAIAKSGITKHKTVQTRKNEQVQNRPNEITKFLNRPNEEQNWYVDTKKQRKYTAEVAY